MSKRTVLVWIDLETTGLKPVSNNRILEYAMVLTDLELNEIYSTKCVVLQSTTAARALMDDFVVQMHEKSGLLAALERAEELLAPSNYADSIDMIDEILRGELAKLDDGNTIFVIAGNTVGFDKDYIKYYMPELFKLLHYRQLDVSAYKVAFPDIFGSATSDAHRAMEDIRASINQHRKMRGLIDMARNPTRVQHPGVKQPTVETTFDEDDGC